MTERGREDLTTAAETLVQTALKVARRERFVVVGDEESAPIIEALERAGRAAGAEVAALRLDELKSRSTNHTGKRPHTVLPDAVRRAMLSAQASVFVASAPRLEAPMRDQLQLVVNACRIRHAHLPGVTERTFAAGLRVDHAAIAAAATKLLRRFDTTTEIRSTSGAGTDLVVVPGTRRWLARVGHVGAGESVVFPTGSVAICPEDVRGTFAATASLGDPFDTREGQLSEPVVFSIAGGAVTSVSCVGHPDLVRDIERTLSFAPGSERIGLVVIGLNGGAKSATGVVDVDQHRPGLHLVIGDPGTRQAGAGWTARTSFVACQAESELLLDGSSLVEGGSVPPRTPARA